MRMDVAEIACRLIETESTPSKGEKKIAYTIKELLNELPLEIEVQEYSENRVNLLAYTKPAEKVRIILMGHMDTVPAFRSWTTDPFKPVVRKGFIYGLGSADMKGALACMIKAAESSLKKGFSFALGFTAEEETTMTGAETLAQTLKRKLPSLKIAVVGEPTNMRIATCHKGVLRVKIKVKGVRSHSSVPKKGENAIHNGVRVLWNLINNGKPEIKHDLLGEPTFSVTMIRGGLSQNIIPDLMEATIDMRLIPPETMNSRVKIIEDVLDRLRRDGINVHMEVLQYQPPYQAPDTREIELALEAARELGLNPEPVGEPYLTEATIYWHKAGVPTIIMGPGRIEEAHRPDEKVSIENLRKTTAYYETLIEKSCLRLNIRSSTA